MKYELIKKEFNDKLEELKLKHGEFYYDKWNYYEEEKELKNDFKLKYFDLELFEIEAIKNIKELLSKKGVPETKELIQKILNDLEV